MVRKALKKKLYLIPPRKFVISSINKYNTSNFSRLSKEKRLGSWAKRQLSLLCRKKQFIDSPQYEKIDVAKLVSNLNNVKSNHNIEKEGNQPYHKHSWINYLLLLKNGQECSRGEVFSNWTPLYSHERIIRNQKELFHLRDISSYKEKLLEDKKLSFLYGKITKREMQKTLSSILPSNSNLKKNHIIHLLQRRLDVSLKQCFLFNTIETARKWIGEGRIVVNQKVIKQPSFLLEPGDVFSIDKASRLRYKQSFLEKFYKSQKEMKYVQSGNLLSQWKRWASLRNIKNYYLLKKANYKSSIRVLGNTTYPDRYIKYYWHTTGRSLIKRSVVWNNQQKKTRLSMNFALLRFNLAKMRWLMSKQGDGPLIAGFWAPRGPGVRRGSPNSSGVRNGGLLNNKVVDNASNFNVKTLQSRYRGHHKENGFQRKTTFLFQSKTYGTKAAAEKKVSWINVKRFIGWKGVYRRRILVFSRWLLDKEPLLLDGLYSLRWHKAFKRKKSVKTHDHSKSLSLEKPLQFEVSYKTLSAIYLFPAQRVFLPCTLDYNLLARR